ncbi:hypothetical protein LguiB_030142 [Lonicera macranthoides]
MFARLRISDLNKESIAGLIEKERNYIPGIDYFHRFHSQPLDTSAREKYVEWILKVIDLAGLALGLKYNEETFIFRSGEGLSPS